MFCQEWNIVVELANFCGNISGFCVFAEVLVFCQEWNIVVEFANLGGNGRNVVFLSVGFFYVCSLGVVGKTLVFGEEPREVRLVQNLCSPFGGIPVGVHLSGHVVSGDVAGIVVESAHIGGNVGGLLHRGGGKVAGVVCEGTHIGGYNRKISGLGIFAEVLVFGQEWNIVVEFANFGRNVSGLGILA